MVANFWGLTPLQMANFEGYGVKSYQGTNQFYLQGMQTPMEIFLLQYGVGV